MVLFYQVFTLCNDKTRKAKERQARMSSDNDNGKKHGGKRPGAGRKPLGEGEIAPVNFKLSQSDLVQLDAAAGNRSEFLRRALQAALVRQEQGQPMEYHAEVEQIVALAEQVKAIRQKANGDPLIVKLLREYAELVEVIEQHNAATINPDTDAPYDRYDVCGELADCGYYNAQSYAQDDDVRDFLATQSLFCGMVSVVCKVEVSIALSLRLTIAKYVCRVAHPTLKQDDRAAAIALERAALKTAFHEFLTGSQNS